MYVFSPGVYAGDTYQHLLTGVFCPLQIIIPWNVMKTNQTYKWSEHIPSVKNPPHTISTAYILIYWDLVTIILLLYWSHVGKCADVLLFSNTTLTYEYAYNLSDYFNLISGQCPKYWLYVRSTENCYQTEVKPPKHVLLWGSAGIKTKPIICLVAGLTILLKRPWCNSAVYIEKYTCYIE